MLARRAPPCQVKSEKDSIGGSVACVLHNVPPALGEPVFDRLEAKLAHAMLSLPATKGFEFGSGFGGTVMRGSQHNDPFVSGSAAPNGEGTAIRNVKNHAGGTLGGISNGSDVYFRVAVKPVSTIGQAQTTTTFDGKEVVLEAKGRYEEHARPVFSKPAPPPPFLRDVSAAPRVPSHVGWV